MTGMQLKAILMALMSPKMSSRAINKQEIAWISESAELIIKECNKGDGKNAKEEKE